MRSVYYSLGGGTQVHLSLVLTSSQYTLVSHYTSVHPTHLVPLTIPHNTTMANITIMCDTHTEYLHAFARLWESIIIWSNRSLLFWTMHTSFISGTVPQTSLRYRYLTFSLTSKTHMGNLFSTNFCNKRDWQRGPYIILVTPLPTFMLW